MVIENLIFANHMSILRNMMNGKRLDNTFDLALSGWVYTI